jgi:hypothetical protein
MDYSKFTVEQLFDEIADALSFKGEVELRLEQAKGQLLKRQIETGETNIEHNGWRSDLRREPVSMAWLEREFGYTKADVPPEAMTEKVSIALDPAKAIAWLTELGHEPKPTYGLTFSRIKGRA